MSIPQPPSSLEGHCSAINNDTLYVLSSDSLQSLPLKENGTWSQEPTGQAVKNPSCVTVTSTEDAADAALFVIGGETDDGNYSGLQRYFYGNKTWETLSPAAADVLQGRTNHSVAYLNDTQNILVYAGSQPSAPSTYSSQTFVLDTFAPFNLRSYTTKSPPLTNPILQPFNSSHAVMAAGSPSNTDIWTFSADNGFVQFQTSLTSPVGSSAKGVVVDGTDGSKVLQIFNFGVSPNTATNIVLLDASGQPATTGQVVGASNSSSTRRKRELTLSNWPAYDSSNAPTATRSDSSIAQDPNGVVAVAGGNSETPIALFNQNENSWIDAGKFFNANGQQPLQPSASSTPAAPEPAPSAPQTSTASTPGVIDPAKEHHKTNVALGAILGTIFGIMALCIVILLFIRYRKRKGQKGQTYLKEKEGNDRMSFADRGASYMREAGVSNHELQLQPPAQSRYEPGNNNSHSSLAIMTGRANANKPPNATGHAQKGSYESTIQLMKDRNGNLVDEPVEMTDISDARSAKSRQSAHTSGSAPTVPEVRTLAPHEDLSAKGNRSSGWSKYFATSQPTGPNGLSHLPSAYVKTNTLSMESDYSSDHQQLSRIPSSALVPPLDIDFTKTIDGQRLSHVASGSPAFSDSREDLAKNGSAGEGQKALYMDSRKSQATSISSYGNRSANRSTMSSTMTDYESHTPWTPMSSFKDHVNERPTSSIYTNSLHDSINPKYSRGKSSAFFPGAGTNFKPQKVKPTHISELKSETSVLQEPAPAKTAQERGSTLTVFPRGVPSAYYVAGDLQPESGSDAKPVNTDMSWLNLGLNKAPAPA